MIKVVNNTYKLEDDEVFIQATTINMKELYKYLQIGGQGSISFFANESIKFTSEEEIKLTEIHNEFMELCRSVMIRDLIDGFKESGWTDEELKRYVKY